MSHFNDRIDDIVSECVTELVHVPTLAAHHAEFVAGAHDIVAIVGFAGSKLSGCVGLAASPETVMSIHPTMPGGNHESRAAEDWLGELGNQLVGRLKRRFSTIDVDVTACIPVVLRGLQVRVARTSPDAPRCFRSRRPEGDILVWMDVRTPEELDFEIREVETDIAAPGSSFFF